MITLRVRTRSCASVFRLSVNRRQRCFHGSPMPKASQQPQQIRCSYYGNSILSALSRISLSVTKLSLLKYFSFCPSVFCLGSAHAPETIQSSTWDMTYLSGSPPCSCSIKFRRIWSHEILVLGRGRPGCNKQPWQGTSERDRRTVEALQDLNRLVKSRPLACNVRDRFLWHN